MTGENKSILSYRINCLIHSQFKKRTNKFLLCFIFIIPLLSNSIIFEPYYKSDTSDGTMTSDYLFENGYLIQHKEGTYSLFINDEISPIKDPTLFTFY